MEGMEHRWESMDLEEHRWMGHGRKEGREHRWESMELEEHRWMGHERKGA